MILFPIFLDVLCIQLPTSQGFCFLNFLCWSQKNSTQYAMYHFKLLKKVSHVTWMFFISCYLHVKISISSNLFIDLKKPWFQDPLQNDYLSVCVLVMTSLYKRKDSICLHAKESQICWVPNQWAQSSCHLQTLEQIRTFIYILRMIRSIYANSEASHV